MATLNAVFILVLTGSFRKCVLFHVVINPCVKIKPIERDTLRSNSYLSNRWAYHCVEYLD